MKRVLHKLFVLIILYSSIKGFLFNESENTSFGSTDNIYVTIEPVFSTNENVFTSASTIIGTKTIEGLISTHEPVNTNALETTSTSLPTVSTTEKVTFTTKINALTTDESKPSTASTIITSETETTHVETTHTPSNRIFYCNFDESTQVNASCGGSLSQFNFGMTPSVMILPSEGLVINKVSTYISDVRSITGPTAKNNTCNIPFTTGFVERYFCANTGFDTFKCEVGDKGSGILDDCVRGNYLKVRTSFGNFSHSFLFTKPIQVTEAGFYKLSFYNLFNCLTVANCSVVNDTMSIKLRRGSNGIYREVYLGGTNYGRLYDDRWIKEEVFLLLNEDDYYLKIDYSRGVTLNSVQGYFFIDEIAIEKAEDGTFTTFTTPESTTSVVTTTTTSTTSTTTTSTTTTTTTLPLNTTTQPYYLITANPTGNNIFYCNFDESTNVNGSCGGSLSQFNFGMTPTVTILSSEGLVINKVSTFISDVRSIAGLTVNNNTCNIPFTSRYVERFFCANTGLDTFKCEVGDKGSGILEDCVRGNYLKVRTSFGNFSHTFFFTKPIQVTEAGLYRLSFYNLFNCLTVANCSVVNDTMSFKIRQGLAGSYEEVYLGGTNYGRLYDDRWVREEVMLQLKPDDYYLKIDFSRGVTLNSVQGYFFIDEIAIEKFTNDSTTSTSTTSTTTTTSKPSTTTSISTTSTETTTTPSTTTTTSTSTTFSTSTSTTTSTPSSTSSSTTSSITSTTASTSTTISTNTPILTTSTTTISTSTESSTKATDSTSNPLTMSSITTIQSVTNLTSASSIVSSSSTQTATVTTNSTTVATTVSITAPKTTSITTPAVTSVQMNTSEKPSSQIGPIIGGSIGGAVVVLIIVGALSYYFLKKKNIQKINPDDDENNNEITTV